MLAFLQKPTPGVEFLTLILAYISVAAMTLKQANCIEFLGLIRPIVSTEREFRLQS